MRTTTALLVAMLVLALAGAAHAASMFAGPLSPNGVSNSCACEAVNVSSGTKTIQIQILDKGNHVLAETAMEPVAKGSAAPQAVHAGGGFTWCKFVNASPTYFRGTMTCQADGQIMVVPAR
jgi:hypothetical protein